MGGKRPMIYLVVIIIVLLSDYIYNNYIVPNQDKLSTITEAVADNSQPSTQSKADESANEITAESADPSAESSPKHQVYRKGWAELPATSSDSDHYTAYHTSQGIRNYSVCFSRKHHCPVWVAAPLHESYKGEVKRRDNYTFDPNLPVEIQPVLKRSYGEYTRGHILGSAERTATRELNDQLFYVTNIAPQTQAGFNAQGGIWNNLEYFVDSQICADTLYVVTGLLFDDFTDSANHTVKASTTTNKNDNKAISVPTAFYKALLRTKGGATGKSVNECSASELKCAAFIVGHYSASRRPSKSDMISIKELERITGIEFFAGVKNAPKHRAAAEDWGLK